ncbi:MAG: redox-sensing transcriptional repressor Rex [Eubacteriales bacterium]|jgi:redox-sensing transcriptional repressor|nr:redox-sensing transcriptional repressor Rex [Eubacteriales bacterium]
MKHVPISLQLYNRLTKYLYYLENLGDDSPENISATTIAKELDLNDVQVRKDLASISDGGKPKVGYVTKDLAADISHFLGHDNTSDAILAGAGNLGKALLNYGNFKNYGLNIVAAFDTDPELAGSECNGKMILAYRKMSDLCKRLSIKIGIITVPAEYAQSVCDTMTESGIKAIWNFAPVNLKTPDDVVVKNEDMAASLAVLIKKLSNREG